MAQADLQTPLVQDDQQVSGPQVEAPKVPFAQAITMGSELVKPDPRVEKAASVFLPDPAILAQKLVDLKKANKAVFQRPASGIWARAMDHNLLATTYLNLMRQQHGTAGKRAWLSRFRTAAFALAHKPQLVLTIEVVEQLAAQLRATDDLFGFIFHRWFTYLHKHAYQTDPDEAFQFSNCITDRLVRVLFMIVVLHAAPHYGLVRAPDPACRGKIQSWYPGHTGRYDEDHCGEHPVGNTDAEKEWRASIKEGDEIDKKEMVFPFHPDWFQRDVPLLTERPVCDWMYKWRKEGKTYCGIDIKHNADYLMEDKLVVANMMITTTLGELKRLNDEAVMLQNKIVGAGTALCTTLGTFVIQKYSDQSDGEL